MQKTNEDCYYFLTSSCAKGSTCPYRHNPAVLTCNVTCPAWVRGNCSDPACLLRHSIVQRPPVSNGTLCCYDNTPQGCLKLHCTFIHLRPRSNLRNQTIPRSSTTNLVNKDAIKPLASTNSPTNTTNDSISSPQINPPTPKIEIPSTPEIIPNRTTIPLENKKLESPPRSVIKDSLEKISDDTTQLRTAGNRNVVIAESANIPNRKVVHGTTNRVVVSSEKINSTKKQINDSDSDLDDLIEQENDTKKTNSLIDIPFPCSVPSMTNRLFTSSKQSTSTNDTKPIRLNRDRLPAATISSPNSISITSNGEKTSAGTGLSHNDTERRTSRIERFKKKPISPPRSVVNSLLTTPTRNVINSSPNERKRPAPEQSLINDSPPSKRLSSQQEENNNNHHHNSTTIGDLCSPSPSNSRRTHERQHHRRPRRRSSSSSSLSSKRKSPPRQTFSSRSSMNDSAWKKEVDAFLARTTQPKISLPQPVPLLSLRPNYIPPLLPPPPLQQKQPQSMIPRHPRPSQRPRQPSSVAIKRPVAPVITPSQVSSKPIEQIPSNNVSPIQSTTTTTTAAIPKQEEDDENELLKLDEPTDVVDTFALIDEALLEADHLLELM